MMKKTAGIHHISAIVGNPKETVAFYSEVLGLRLIKKTVNFDDPGTYHLYFGNEEGTPGTIMTFFPWPKAYSGTVGTGQVGRTMFFVSEDALDFWSERLRSFNIKVEQKSLFGEETLFFQDSHGLNLAIAARPVSAENTWLSEGIPEEKSIKGFAGAALLSAQPDKTAELLENHMGFEKVEETEDYIRFKAEGTLGNTIDLKKSESLSGTFGVGTVHHIAFRSKDFSDHLEWQDYLMDSGYPTTEVKDRQYFKAIYFKEPGGIIMEIATDTPGFTVDEPLEHLGETLLLPEWLESKRSLIEAHLPLLS